MKTSKTFIAFQFSGDGKMIQTPGANILYSAAKSVSSNSHWIISPSKIHSNAVLYVMPLYFNIDCQKARLTISNGIRNDSYCGSTEPPSYRVFSANRQLWIRFEKKGDDLKDQGFGLQYFTENLGKDLDFYNVVFR